MFQKLRFPVMLVVVVLVGLPLVARAETFTGEGGSADHKILWIDVRTQAEYDKDHIDNDLRVDWQNIVPFVEARVSDKSQPIALYCHSGRRAGMAQALLQKAGYTNVLDAGGIETVRKDRRLPAPQ